MGLSPSVQPLGCRAPAGGACTTPVEMGTTTRMALERLLDIALGTDAQARRASDFLLAWWDPDLHGGFALSDLWSMDDDTARACVLVFAWVAANRAHPRQIGYGPQFEVLFCGVEEIGWLGM